MLKEGTFMLRMIEKEQNSRNLKVEGTLLGKIVTLMVEKGTKTLQLGMNKLKKNKNNKGTLFDKVGHSWMKREQTIDGQITEMQLFFLIY